MHFSSFSTLSNSSCRSAQFLLFLLWALTLWRIDAQTTDGPMVQSFIESISHRLLSFFLLTSSSIYISLLVFMIPTPFFLLVALLWISLQPFPSSFALLPNHLHSLLHTENVQTSCFHKICICIASPNLIMWPSFFNRTRSWCGSPCHWTELGRFIYVPLTGDDQAFVSTYLTLIFMIDFGKWVLRVMPFLLPTLLIYPGRHRHWIGQACAQLSG